MLSSRQRENLRAQRGKATGRPQQRQAGRIQEVEEDDEEDDEGSEEDRRRLVNKARSGTGMEPILSRKTQAKLASQEEELRALQDQLKGLEGTLGADLQGVMSQLNDLKGKTKSMDRMTSGLSK